MNVARTGVPTERDREPHLRDLFQLGEEITIQAPTNRGLKEIHLWMRPPNPEQTQEALRKAGARQARERAAYRNKEGERYLTLTSEVDQFEDKDQLLEFLLSTEDNETKERAYNDILYGDWGHN